jgi:hypothetical protein
MKRIHEVTSEEENFRLEPRGGFQTIKRDFVKPEPEGTIVLLPFRILSWEKDCDGSAMATMENIDFNGDATGWEVSNIGLYGNGFVATIKEIREVK